MVYSRKESEASTASLSPTNCDEETGPAKNNGVHTSSITRTVTIANANDETLQHSGAERVVHDVAGRSLEHVHEIVVDSGIGNFAQPANSNAEVVESHDTSVQSTMSNNGSSHVSSPTPTPLSRTEHESMPSSSLVNHLPRTVPDADENTRTHTTPSAPTLTASSPSGHVSQSTLATLPASANDVLSPLRLNNNLRTIQASTQNDNTSEVGVGGSSTCAYCSRCEKEYIDLKAKHLRLKTRIVETGKVIDIINKQKAKIKTLVGRDAEYKRQLNEKEKNSKALLAIVSDQEMQLKRVNVTAVLDEELKKKCKEYEDIIKLNEEMLRSRDAHIKQLSAVTTNMDEISRKEQVAQLRKELKDAKLEHATETSELAKLKRTHTRLTKEGLKWKQDCMKAKDEVKTLKEELKTLREEAKAFKEEKKRVSLKSVSDEKHMERLESEKFGALQRIRRAEETAKVSLAKVATLQTKVAELEMVQSSMTQLEELCEKLRLSEGMKTEAAEVAQTRASMLQEKVEQLEGKCEEMKLSSSKYMSEKTEVISKAYASALETKVAQLEMECEELRLNAGDCVSEKGTEKSQAMDVNMDMAGDGSMNVNWSGSEGEGEALTMSRAQVKSIEVAGLPGKHHNVYPERGDVMPMLSPLKQHDRARPHTPFNITDMSEISGNHVGNEEQEHTILLDLDLDLHRRTTSQAHAHTRKNPRESMSNEGLVGEGKLRSPHNSPMPMSMEEYRSFHPESAGTPISPIVFPTRNIIARSSTALTFSKENVHNSTSSRADTCVHKVSVVDDGLHLSNEELSDSFGHETFKENMQNVPEHLKPINKSTQASLNLSPSRSDIISAVVAEQDAESYGDHDNDERGDTTATADKKHTPRRDKKLRTDYTTSICESTFSPLVHITSTPSAHRHADSQESSVPMTQLEFSMQHPTVNDSFISPMPPTKKKHSGKKRGKRGAKKSTKANRKIDSLTKNHAHALNSYNMGVHVTGGEGMVGEDREYVVCVPRTHEQAQSSGLPPVPKPRPRPSLSDTSSTYAVTQLTQPPRSKPVPMPRPRPGLDAPQSGGAHSYTPVNTSGVESPASKFVSGQTGSQLQLQSLTAPTPAPKAIVLNVTTDDHVPVRCTPTRSPDDLPDISDAVLPPKSAAHEDDERHVNVGMAGQGSKKRTRSVADNTITSFEAIATPAPTNSLICTQIRTSPSASSSVFRHETMPGRTALKNVNVDVDWGVGGGGVGTQMRVEKRLKTAHISPVENTTESVAANSSLAKLVHQPGEFREHLQEQQKQTTTPTLEPIQTRAQTRAHLYKQIHTAPRVTLGPTSVAAAVYYEQMEKDIEEKTIESQYGELYLLQALLDQVIFADTVKKYNSIVQEICALLRSNGALAWSAFERELLNTWLSSSRHSFTTSHPKTQIQTQSEKIFENEEQYRHQTENNSPHTSPEKDISSLRTEGNEPSPKRSSRRPRIANNIQRSICYSTVDNVYTSYNNDEACSSIMGAGVVEGGIESPIVTDQDDRLVRLALDVGKHHMPDHAQRRTQNAKRKRGRPKAHTETSEWVYGLLSSLANLIHMLIAPHSGFVSSDTHPLPTHQAIPSDMNTHCAVVLSNLYAVLSITHSGNADQVYTLCHDLAFVAHPHACMVIFASLSRLLPSLLLVTVDANINGVEKLQKGSTHYSNALDSVLVLSESTIVNISLQCVLATRLLDCCIRHGGESVNMNVSTDVDTTSLCISQQQHILAYKRLVRDCTWLEMSLAANALDECISWCMDHLGVTSNHVAATYPLSNSKNDKKSKHCWHRHTHIHTQAAIMANSANPSYSMSTSHSLSSVKVLKGAELSLGALLLLRLLFNAVAESNTTKTFRYFYDNVARVCVESFLAYRREELNENVVVSALLVLGIGGAVFRGRCESRKDEMMMTAVKGQLTEMISGYGSDELPLTIQTAAAAALLDISSADEGSCATVRTWANARSVTNSFLPPIC
eukprot:CFRG3436T1